MTVLLFFNKNKTTAAGVKCCVATIKRLPAFHHNADYIFISFGIIKPVLVILKIGYRLSLYWGGGCGEWGPFTH